MVPVGCADCEGCSECCRSTADTIILDPQDMYLLSKGTGKVFTDMIEREIEIRKSTKGRKSTASFSRTGAGARSTPSARGSAACIQWEDITRMAASATSFRKMSWHDFRKRVEKVVPMLTEKSRDSVQRYILQVFFVHPYLTRQDFYPQYEARMQVCRKALRSIL